MPRGRGAHSLVPLGRRPMTQVAGGRWGDPGGRYGVQHSDAAARHWHGRGVRLGRIRMGAVMAGTYVREVWEEHMSDQPVSLLVPIRN